MALAKLSAILDDLIGALGQITFSHVKNGLASKEKSQPGSKNPYTPSQSQINRRNEFRIPALRWKTLTPEQIKAWCDLADSIKRNNVFGQSYESAGFNLYVELNHNLQIIGLPIYDDAPVKPIITPLTRYDVICTNVIGNKYNIGFTGQTTNTNTYHEIYATPGQNIGRNYVRNLYRYLTAIPPLTTDVYNFTNEYLNEYGEQQGTKKIFIKLVPVEKNTGFTGVDMYKYGITPALYNELDYSQLDYNFVLAP